MSTECDRIKNTDQYNINCMVSEWLNEGQVGVAERLDQSNFKTSLDQHQLN